MWHTQKKSGEKKLAAYILETDRPIDLRIRAFDFLVQKKHFDYILTVINELKDLEEKAAPEEKLDHLSVLEEAAIGFIERDIEPTSTTGQKAIAADLAFFLMSEPQGASLLKKREKILPKITEWALDFIRTGQKSTSLIQPSEILLATAYVGGDPILDLIKEQLNKYTSLIPFVVQVHSMLLKLRDPKVTLMMSEVLLKCAQKNYPNNINLELINAMVDNGNQTLLKYLIEMNKDRVVKQKVLWKALKESSNLLEKEGLENYQRLLSSPQTHYKHLFTALYLMWKYGGIEHLAQSLKSIHPNFSTPVSGNLMKVAVQEFCERDLIQKKNEARPILINLLDELKDKYKFWPARLYVVTCMYELYPDDFSKIMNEKGRYQKYYAKDKTRIPAWYSERNTTLGEIVQDYMKPR